MTSINITTAKQIVTSLTFENVPAGWVFDFDRMARAYKKYIKYGSHDVAVSQINYYLHHYRAYGK